jgi:soluble lytic murein transglycosylase-like protein
MRKQTIFAGLTIASLLVIALPLQAQIASYVDDHGRVVYTNADSPKVPTRSTMSPSPSASPSTGAESSAANPPGPLDRIVQDAAERHNLDPALVKAVISTESGWNSRAISRKGAMGLMQLEPGTAQRFGVWNPFDPEQNVEGGSAYLKALLDHYNGDLTRTLAAYNAGEHAVDSSGGVPAIPETQQYVQKVTNKYFFAPGSNGASERWEHMKSPPVRKEVETDGKVVFTNQ